VADQKSLRQGDVGDRPMNTFVRPLANRPDAETRLFCFPYAGGGISTFRDWSTGLPENIEPWAIQLPGREDRVATPALDRMGDVINALVPAVIPQLDRPFAFFGHSMMGAVVAWELARALQQLEAGSPVEVFVSGCVPPQVREAVDPPLHSRDRDDLVRTLRSWRATPEAVLDDPELMDLVLPVMRADLAVVETYRFTEAPQLLCPVTAFGGNEDEAVGRAPLLRWRELTLGEFDLKMFPGDHFFLHSARQAVLDEIATRLNSRAVHRSHTR